MLFVVFSDDWGEHQSSCQHIFKHIIKNYKVLWVNTIGMRGVKFTKTDLKKVILKGRKMFARANRTHSVLSRNTPANLEVIQPFMLPFVTAPSVRKFNAKCVINAVNKKLKELGESSPIIVTTVPNACDYVGFLGEKKVVYYCVDDFKEWPGLKKQMVNEMEENLIAKADCFIATSSKLYDRLKAAGKSVELLTHGVDLEHFKELPEREHYLLNEIPKPRVGYFGLFDERSDQELICNIANGMPNVSFVITGDVVIDISKLRKVPNIYFTGSVSYEELPSIVSGWDVCMLPYKINTLSESINPLKLKEYIATGKPICATCLPEVSFYRQSVQVYSTVEEWIEWLDRYFSQLKHDHFCNIEVILNESWSGKSEKFLSFTIC